MSKLFISYKRGTDGIERLKNALNEARYEFWIDNQNIPLGSPDWLHEITEAIKASPGIILCMTPKACKSSYVQQEVEIAKKYNKHIFPIILKSVRSIRTSLIQVGLPERSHVENLSFIDGWEKKFEKLLDDLKKADIHPTRFLFLEMIGGFHKAYQAEDYSAASEWIKRIRQAEQCKESIFDCDFYEYLVEFRWHEAADNAFYDSISDEYNLISEMSDYAPQSHTWKWLHEFLAENSGFSDFDNVAEKIRQAVGIQSINIQYQHKDQGIILSWSFPPNAKMIKITRQTLSLENPADKMLHRNFSDDFRPKLFKIGNTDYFIVYADSGWTKEFGADIQTYKDDNCNPKFAYAYYVSCLYHDQYKKPFMVEEKYPLFITENESI